MTNLSDYITPISGLSYYVAMLDYQGRIGMGADVDPECTRADVVQVVIDHIARGKTIIHVKFIQGNDIEDVTHEIVAEAQAQMMEAAE